MKSVGFVDDIGTLHLDRGYDSGAVRQRFIGAGITDVNIQLRGTKVPGVKKQPVRLGLRSIVEATSSWWSNYGQLRRNTDRRIRHRHAAPCLATTVLIVGRLLDYRDRWSRDERLSAQLLKRPREVSTTCYGQRADSQGGKYETWTPYAWRTRGGRRGECRLRNRCRREGVFAC